MEPRAKKTLGSFLGGKVSSKSKKLFFIIVVILSIIIVFLIFNTGNPNSILRYIIKDPSYDFIILFALAVLLSLMSFYYAHTNETGGYEKIVQANLKNIRRLRKNRKTNKEIAETILNAMNMRRGYRYHYALRRLIILLGRIE